MSKATEKARQRLRELEARDLVKERAKWIAKLAADKTAPSQSFDDALENLGKAIGDLLVARDPEFAGE